MAPPRLSWFLRRPEGAGGYVAPWLSDAEGSASPQAAPASSSGRPGRPAAARPPPAGDLADDDDDGNDPDLAAALAASLAGTRIGDGGGASAATEAENRALAAAKRLSLAGDGGRPAALSYKLWSVGELAYDDAVSDGLYDVAGAFEGLGGMAEDGSGPAPLFPPLADLARLVLPPGDGREVTLVDFGADGPLRDVDGAAAAALADACGAGPAACVSALARVVITAGGGPGSAAALAAAAAAALPALRSARRGAAVLPLGDRLARGPTAPGSASLRHRALLFKALADACALPCRLTHVRAGRPPPPGGTPADPALIHVTVDRQEWLVDLGAPPAAAAAWAVTAAPPTRAVLPVVEEAAPSPPPSSADGGGGPGTPASAKPSPSAPGPVPALPPPPGDAPRERAAAAVAAAAAAQSAAASPAAAGDGTASAAVARTAARLQAAADAAAAAAAAATPPTPASAAPADSAATPPGGGLPPPRTSVALIDLSGSDELGDDAASAAVAVEGGGGRGGRGGGGGPDVVPASAAPSPPPPHVVHSSSAPDLAGLAAGPAPGTTTTSPFAAAPLPPPPAQPAVPPSQPPPPPGAALPPHHASSVPLPVRTAAAAPPAARPRPSAEAAAGLRAARAAAAGLPTPAILDPFVGLSPFPPPAAGAPAAGPSAKDLLARVPAVDAPGRGGASAFHEFSGGGPVAAAAAAAAPAAPPPALPPLRNEPPGGGVGRFLGETAAAAAPATATASAAAPPQPAAADAAAAAADDPWEIDPAEIVMGPRIGIGSFGEVFRAQWRKTDVAVKILYGLESDGPGAVAEFKREVALMRKLLHPNIVQFLGAVTKVPDGGGADAAGPRPWPGATAGGGPGTAAVSSMAILTNYCPGGSLYRLLHKPGGGPRPVFDARRCARMALDVARGMHYLHSCSPPIIHRDLKSPNLLVDAGGVVRVCDFGLSAVRSGRTYLSARSRAGTPEWTAPEVLRSQGCNEKSDVYSFAVVLWELFTQLEPWAELTSVQVVGAVGFGGARLPIPPTVPPAVCALIEACWADEPRSRPDFGSIIDSLTAFLKAEAAASGGGGGGSSSASGAVSNKA